MVAPAFVRDWSVAKVSSNPREPRPEIQLASLKAGCCQFVPSRLLVVYFHTLLVYPKTLKSCACAWGMRARPRASRMAATEDLRSIRIVVRCLVPPFLPCGFPPLTRKWEPRDVNRERPLGKAIGAERKDYSPVVFSPNAPFGERTTKRRRAAFSLSPQGGEGGA